MSEHTLEALVDFVWKIESPDIQEERVSKFILQDEDGGIIVAVTPFEGNEQKDIVITELAKMIVAQKVKLVRYVMVSEAWASKPFPEDGERPVVPPSQDPERRELLIAIGVERSSQEAQGFPRAGRTLMRQAEIFTERGVRSLGEVENFPDSVGGGRMAELFDKVAAARMSLN